MRVVGALLGIVMGTGALAGTIWVARYWHQDNSAHRYKTIAEAMTAKAHEAPPPTKEPPADAKKLDGKPQQWRPQVADKPPFPKVETKERTFEFGAMGVNEEKKHLFKIKNVGQGPLELGVGDTTCKCTISSLSKKALARGEAADVEMSWTPKDVSPNFAQQATIWTNDPDTPEIHFKVYGEVTNKFVVSPEKVWHVGHITDAQEAGMNALLYSNVQKFSVKSVDSANPHVKVTVAPMDVMHLLNTRAKSGYDFHVKVDKGIAMGQFRVPVRIHTTLEGNSTIEIDVTGSRSGPLLFLPPIGRGLWNAEKSWLNLGRVDHEKGSKVTLPAIIYGTEEKFKVLKTTSDADFVKVSAEPNPEISSGVQQGVMFVFEIPPGAPAVTRTRPNAVHVTLDTNHPRLKQMSFELEFVIQ